ncbi:Hypothetical protein CINCED_3A008698 [Cinara cedri]|uniref:Uncharacterized protein n=1 Tax=Cinara cedri TaxID=506608 RepID=A0A5E4NLG9_9HEMI|nr:Hypothetical protein CINCED_3A008698 [Cinara cedri]
MGAEDTRSLEPQPPLTMLSQHSASKERFQSVSKSQIEAASSCSGGNEHDARRLTHGEKRCGFSMSSVVHVYKSVENNNKKKEKKSIIHVRAMVVETGTIRHRYDFCSRLQACTRPHHRHPLHGHRETVANVRVAPLPLAINDAIGRRFCSRVYHCDNDWG